MLRAWMAPAGAVLLIAGCANNDYPVRRVETPVNVTHEVAFGDYRKVYNTAYHIVNRYGVIQTASYRYGEITALISEDVSLFDKTRRTIQARIFPKEDYYDVECRVLVSVEDSEVKAFPDQFQRPYSWKTIASDPGLEVRLNNEIRAALSGGAWEAKEPLTPKPIRPANDVAPRKRASAQGVEEPTDEVRLPGRSKKDSAQVAVLAPDAYERSGVASLKGGSPERAEAAFREALVRDPKDPFGHWLLAHALLEQGKMDEAAAEVVLGIEVNPAWLRGRIGLTELHRSEVLAARTSELQERSGSRPALLTLLAYVRLAGGDPHAALALCERRLEQGRDPASEALRQEVLELLERTQGLEEF